MTDAPEGERAQIFPDLAVTGLQEMRPVWVML